MEINEKKEPVEFSKKVGLAEWKVLRFNPTRHELNQILGKEGSEDDKEIDYSGQVKAWLQDVNSGFKTPATFFIEDEDSVSQNGKTQYVNAVGKSSYSDSEGNLKDWFKKAMTYRVAKKGEAELMEFVRNWLQDIQLNVDKGGNKNNILLDMAKLFAGDVRELNDLVHSEFAGTTTALACVRTKTTPDGIKQYQNVFNKKFLPGYCIKYFTGSGKTTPQFVEEFKAEVSGEHGCKDFFVLEPLRDYKEGENPVEKNTAVLEPNTPRY
jgi:hypothetical protein